MISPTFEEVQPTPDPYGNPGRIAKIQPITRTPIQLTAELNLLIQHGDGRVLADPRIVTLFPATTRIFEPVTRSRFSRQRAAVSVRY